jgi:hypothetical protein
MRPNVERIQRTDKRNRSISEMEKSVKSKKVADRRGAKLNIQSEINEAEEMQNEHYLENVKEFGKYYSRLLIYK